MLFKAISCSTFTWTNGYRLVPSEPRECLGLKSCGVELWHTSLFHLLQVPWWIHPNLLQSVGWRDVWSNFMMRPGAQMYPQPHLLMGGSWLSLPLILHSHGSADQGTKSKARPTSLWVLCTPRAAGRKQPLLSLKHRPCNFAWSLQLGFSKRA